MNLKTLQITITLPEGDEVEEIKDLLEELLDGVDIPLLYHMKVLPPSIGEIDDFEATYGEGE